MKLSIFAIATGAAIGIVIQSASADISGFGNLVGWQYNQSDAGSPATYDSGTDTLQITNTAGGEARSVFFGTPQSITAFTASFTYRVNYPGNPTTFGTALVLQNDPDGAMALGAGQGSLGYGGITKSVAISLELPGSRSGYYTNGALGGGSMVTTPVSISAGNPLDVTISYDGTFLHQSIVDTVTSAVFTKSYIAPDIASILGGSTAYVGFTASTNIPGFGSGANQYISNPHFAIPAPASLPLMGMVGFIASRRRR
ncbi:MAG: hypothetical protein H6812_10600 [Phycisphaeraceae bacterium]|nr:hypothetical protein [Phycisphaerales bacterium]MCB9843696.1 hypothetical protein [Phycisphaeraceae bacterium]